MEEEKREALSVFQRLGFNLLIYMGSMPREVVADKVVRKERREGKRIIPALVAAKFVGREHFATAKDMNQVTDILPPHSGSRLLEKASTWPPN